MSAHTPHELAEAFPEDAAALHRLKQEDAHYVRLARRHHEVNRAIHRIDERLEALKKERLHLLDEIALMLEQAPAN